MDQGLDPTHPHGLVENATVSSAGGTQDPDGKVSSKKRLLFRTAFCYGGLDSGEGSQPSFIRCTDHPIDLLAADKEAQIGDATDLMCPSEFTCLIDIDLHDLESALVLLGQVGKARGQGAAGATPIGVEIDQDREVRGDHLGLEFGRGRGIRKEGTRNGRLPTIG